jgi:hypothetical protein
VLFSSTADTAWNDLPVRLSFVPLIHRTLGSIIQRQDEGLNLRVGEKFTRRIGTEFLDKDVTFTPPGQTEAYRDLRRVTLVNNWPLLQYEGTDFAGVYEARHSDPPLLAKFAAQPDAAESSLQPLSDAQLKTLNGVAHVLEWKPNMSLRGLFEKDRTGVELWLPLAVLALLAAGAETFLAQWFSRSK